MTLARQQALSGHLCPSGLEPIILTVLCDHDAKPCRPNVYGLDQKSCKWWKKVFCRLLMSTLVNSWIAYCELKHRKDPFLDFLVPLAEALMASEKLNAQYQRRRGTRRPSK
ncbi:piggyBac transposable element-derived protein 4 [Trichonephila clavata]|uniref:PiggyBac transposable element-derived protein 4 n=1 Tax=Trichonephila clavata TaxID=2740835 RepID=A0A8X6KSP4_TRICU|nr:piggyBac transposable element-derived protein 4 [Trichonephila clavata]